MATLLLGARWIVGAYGRREIWIESVGVVAELRTPASGGRVKTSLKLTSETYDQLIAHLLPADNSIEQAAFLFATLTEHTPQSVTLEVIEIATLAASDFDEQASDYLELSDRTRASLIKRAHDLGASLIESHSHPGSLVAAFSPSDLLGLKETVPHMWWRLHKRPYIAIVVAPTGFDALVWLESPEVPRALDSVVAGRRLLRPTNKTLLAAR
jgi:hypothetical protein